MDTSLLVILFDTATITVCLTSLITGAVHRKRVLKEIKTVMGINEEALEKVSTMLDEYEKTKVIVSHTQVADDAIKAIPIRKKRTPKI